MVPHIKFRGVEVPAKVSTHGPSHEYTCKTVTLYWCGVDPTMKRGVSGGGGSSRSHLKTTRTSRLCECVWMDGEVSKQVLKQAMGFVVVTSSQSHGGTPPVFHRETKA